MYNLKNKIKKDLLPHNSTHPLPRPKIPPSPCQPPSPHHNILLILSIVYLALYSFTEKELDLRGKKSYSVLLVLYSPLSEEAVPYIYRNIKNVISQLNPRRLCLLPHRAHLAHPQSELSQTSPSYCNHGSFSCFVCASIDAKLHIVTNREFTT